MGKEQIEKRYNSIEKKLKKELIGQSSYTKELCSYYKEKTLKDEKGVLLVAGKRGTFKKASIRLIFEHLYENNLIDNINIEEINLGVYNFNLGYNSFLTDLYEKLNSNSNILIFKNVEKASEEIIKVLSDIYPNSCLRLGQYYTMKNTVLVEAEEEEKDKLNSFVCYNKFFIFVYNTDEKELIEEMLPNKDMILYTKPLTVEEKNVVIRNEFVKKISKFQDETKVDIQVGMTVENEDDLGLCTFLQEDFKENSNIGVSDYISYKIYKPLKNLLEKEELQGISQIFLYVKDNEIYCKANNNIYKLSGYVTPTIEEARYKLDSIIGIKELKEYILKVENNYKVQKIREKLGLKSSQISMNMIFTGNAGTGKTNAARVTYEYLNALGIISKSIFKEVSKADFISDNINETAKKTIEVIDSALGGVLFIDEAYSLCEGEEDKQGKEIVDALLKGIEDNRDNLVVIMAGYEKDMERFLAINQGLKSRFPNIIHFHDYNPVEMYEIAVNIAKSKGYRIAKGVKNDLIDLFTKNQLTGKNDLGNARFVRNIIENAIMDASKKYISSGERQIDLLARDNFNFKIKAKFDLESKLKEIVGLEEVKNLLRSQYKLIVAQEKRKSVGINTKIEQNLNMVFTGNPGTGKTSVARLVAEMLNSMGLLKVGQLVETDRSNFVGAKPGETAKKTENTFREALGGVLFIDEAYTLANDSLGIEAIETLLKLIEDNAGEVVVILAGYEEEMENFFDINIGLRSRFPLWTHFADYNPKELLEMSIRLVEAKGFKLSKNGYNELKKSFVDIYENSDMQSGNGRMVRNYVEKLIRNQSIRIVEEDISEYEMNLINYIDVMKINVDDENEFILEEKLKVLVGNETAKEFLRDQYKVLKVREKRKRLGFKNELNKYLNVVFTGENGTGKRTVANILSEMFYSFGVVKAKNIVEINNYDLISRLNKDEKLEDILSKSIGKVIFIDKIYTILENVQCEKFIEELVDFIDKNSNRCIIILSGNKKEIKELILSKPGINFRFTTWFDFEDYDYKSLCNIARGTLERKGFILCEEAEEALNKAIINMYGNTKLTLKNGLMIKQFLDILVRVQSIRICDEDLNIDRLNYINNQDILKSEDEFIKKNTF